MIYLKTYKNLLGLLALLSCLLTAVAQEQQNINGRAFIIYEVVQGETLYSISKSYKVATEDLIEENPSLKSGLKLGQEIKIPLDKVITEEPQVQKIIPEGFVPHEVKQSETLYGLSKRYGVTVRAIIDSNPEVVNGLKPGQIIVFPGSKQEVNEPEVKQNLPKNLSQKTDSFKIHVVQKGETLYSLVNRYELTINQVELLNPGVKKGISLGQELRLPLISEEVSESQIISENYVNETFVFDSSITSLSDTLIIQDLYHVALLLPFYLDMNDTISARQKGFDEETIYKKSGIALQFYQGALLALDSLRKLGVAVKLHVFDTENDTSKVNTFVRNNDSINYNLIIGPLYKSNFRIVSEYSRKNSVPIVVPVPQSNKILLGNEFVSKTAPSRYIQMETIANHVVTKYNKDENVFVINTGEDDKKLLAAFLRKARAIEDTLGEMQDTLRMVSFGKLKEEKIIMHLDSTVQNVIVVPTVDPVFVYDLLTLLNGLSKDYDCVVYGLDKWQSFDNLEPDFLHNLNIHLTSPYYVDYERPDVNALVKLFREKYFTEPSKYGFLGYDVALYYIGLLDKYGVNMQSYLDNETKDGIAQKFDFFKSGMESGFENQSVFMLKYEDYQLTRIN